MSPLSALLTQLRQALGEIISAQLSTDKVHARNALTLLACMAIIVSCRSAHAQEPILNLGGSAYENAGNMKVQIRLESPGAVPVIVRYDTQNLTAIAGVDYIAQSGTVSWIANDPDASKFIAIPLIENRLLQNDRTFRVILSNPTGGAYIDPRYSPECHILDDEYAAHGRMHLMSVAGGQFNESAGNAKIQVERRQGSTGSVSVRVRTVDGDAQAGTHYHSVDSVVVWADGDNAVRTINVPLIDNSGIGGRRSFSVMLSEPSGGAVLGLSAINVKIFDDDGMYVELLEPNVSVAEGAGTVSVKARRRGHPVGDLRFAYAVGGEGTATGGQDYMSTNLAYLEWATGDVTDKTITVPIFQDSLREGNENFYIVLLDYSFGSAQNGALDRTMVTIIDDEAAPEASGTLAMAQSSVRASEGSSVRLTVMRTGGRSGTVSAIVSTANGSAISPGDYQENSTFLVWGDGDASSKSVLVTVNADALVEGNETFTMTLSTVLGAALGQAITTISITDVPSENNAPEMDVMRGAAKIAVDSRDTITETNPSIAKVVTYSIANTGRSVLTLGTPGNPPFLVSAQSNCNAVITTQAASSIAASGMSSLVVSVTPTTLGLWSFTLSSVNNDANENPYSWTVNGTAGAGAAPEMDVSRGATVIFNKGADTAPGSIAGTASIVRYEIANIGTAQLTIGNFTLSGISNCSANIISQPFSIAAGAAASALEVSIAPVAVGAWSVTLSAITNDPDENPFTWTIRGTAGSGIIINGPGDVNGDRVVNARDYAAVAEKVWTIPTSPGWDPKLDANGDGVINHRDLQVVLANYGNKY